MIAFWALTRDPNSDGRRTVAEPLLVIRDARKPGVVYPFSFTDAESAYDFIRKEIEHGLELWQVALYWAVTIHASVDSQGKSSVSPSVPPPGAPATAPAPAELAQHLPPMEAWESGQPHPIGGPTRVVRRDDESPARDAGANGTPETNGTGARQLPPEAAKLTEGMTPIAPRNGKRPPEVSDPSTDAQEAITRAIEEALQIVRGERKRRHPRPKPMEDEASAGVPPDVPAPDDDLDEGPLHEMIDEIERFRQRQRWEDQRGPFRGFGSPPGKF